jgi:hypothetical protein
VLSSLPEASVDPSCSVSGQCGGRDETRPVSAGEGTRRVRSVRGKGQDASGQCGGRDETRPLSAGKGTRRVRSVRGGRSTGEKATHATGYLCPLSGTPTVSPAHGGRRVAFVKSLL